MTKHVLIIDSHPDPRGERFNHALAGSYARGAREAGHDVRTLMLADVEVPFLRTQDEWQSGKPSPAIAAAQEDILWADHLVIIYPLWLGSMPAYLKAFLEQVIRPGVAIKEKIDSLHPGLLQGKSARVVVTMGMPAVIYRWYFGAHSLRSLERNILRFAGIKPVRHTIIGMVAAGEERGKRWLEKMEALGREAL